MNIVKHRLRAALRRARRDARGVALQTVIVIVVLLMIAGGVSAVLLSRSSDVVGQLEAQGVGAITKDNCPITQVASVSGAVGEVATAAGATATGFLVNTKVCVWKGKSEITPAQCFAAANGKILSADPGAGGVTDDPGPNDAALGATGNADDQKKICVASIA